MGVNGIYGLSGSGLDIESLVKMGMSGKNKQYDKLEQQEIANTWLKEAYNDVYMDMTKYKYGTLSTYKMQSNMNAMQASSSNTGVVTATANGAAAAMNHTVEVSSVASNAYLLTAQKSDGTNYGVTRNTENKDLKNSNKLADVIFKDYTKLSESADGVGYYNVKFADGTSTNVSGSDVAISLTLKDTVGDNAKEYTLTYTYDDLFKDEKTLNDFASAIARTGANIQGGYDTANDSFSFYNKTSGKENIIGITADNGNTAVLLNNLNLGEYSAANNVLSDRIDFTSNDAIATTMESTGTINNLTKSVSLKDVLGLSATWVKNADNSNYYDVTVTDKNNQSLGTFTVDSSGNAVDGADTTVFSMNLSNGNQAQDKTISFTLGELFDLNGIGKKSKLNSAAGLDEFAAKINNAGLGITAEYDATEDSFSMVNKTGKAVLTANGSVTSQSVAQQLIESLNLEPSEGLTYLSVTNSNNLASVFGLSAKIIKPSNYNLTVYNSSGQSVAVQSGSNDNIKDDGRNLFTFNISDGSDKSATISLSFGDIVDYSKINHNGGGLANIKIGNTVVSTSTTTPVSVPTRTDNNLGSLTTRINTALANAGLENITATYKDGTFSLVNPDGKVVISNITGSKVDVVDRLSLAKVTNPDSMDNYADLSSNKENKISRVKETSTDDNLSDAFGLTAVKTGEDTMTITKSDGTTEDVKFTDTAFSVWVGDSTRQTEVAVTYAELFDTDGSGILNGKFDFGDFASKINTVASDKGINVTASYDYSTGKITLSNDIGNAYMSGGDAIGTDLVSRLGFAETADSKAHRAEVQKTVAGEHTFAGTNASVTIDGKTYDNTTNKLTVAGVTYTFLDSTKDEDTGIVKKATVSVSQDTDKIVDYVKSFVDEYNTLLDSLNEKLSEKKYSDYKPLSKRQEDEMTEKQIEKWTEKAKSGLLYHNSDIQALVSDMREAIYTKVDAVDSQYNTLSSIGITTTNTKGHLTLDTDKLKKALAEDPDCIYQLFASDQDSSYIAGSTNKNKITEAQKRVDYANTGIANRLDNVMTTHMKKISDVAGTSKDTDDQSYLGKLITQMQAKMQSFKTLMTSYENKLYKRYDAMEVALSRLNMQLGYISGSFS